MTEKRKKLNLSVNRRFQVWLLTRILGVIIVSSLVAVLILYFFARQEVSSSFYEAHIQIRRVSDLLLPVMGAGAVVSLLSGVVLALFLPQKLAGPIYRVQRGLDLIRAGDLTVEIHLRENDTLTDLAASVNGTTDALRVKLQEVKGIQAELDRFVTSFGDEDAASISGKQNEALEFFKV